MDLYLIPCITFFSSASFIFFGMGCFISKRMKQEFIRYGLSRFRKTVGLLQLLGAAGLFFGYTTNPQLHYSAAAGLCILMVFGFITRIKIKDTALQAAPSLFYAILNGYLCYILV